MKNRVMKRVLQARQIANTTACQKAQFKMSQAFSIDEIASLHTAYTTLLYDDLKHGGDGSSPSIRFAEQAYLNALSAYGYDKSSFEVAHSCAKCNDTGAVNGKICDCIWDEYIKELKIECEIDTKAQFSFGDCRLEDMKDDTHRQEIEQYYLSFEKYTESYPKITFLNIILSGGIGTGKSCLASSSARRMVERGMSVKYVSAYEFNSTMLTVHTSPIAMRNSIMSDFLTCDMLVIDDLGTEPMLKNVTLEYLLMVLEERLIKKHCTLITTNLSQDSLLDRYKERIFSRLSDKNNSLFFSIHGNDLRK